jgi:hypothetical protein
VTLVGPPTLRLEFDNPAFQGVDVLIEVENRSHCYTYVPTVPLELEPTNKLLLSLRLTTLPHTRNVHLLMIAEGLRRSWTGCQAFVGGQTHSRSFRGRRGTISPIIGTRTHSRDPFVSH